MKSYALATCALIVAQSVAQAQGLECSRISEHGGAQYGAVVEIETTIEKSGLSSDYFVTGGGCDFSGGQGFGISIWEKPTERGYSCKAIARSSTEYVVATAYAIVCRNQQSQGGRRAAPFSNVGLGGDSVSIVRTTQKQIPYSVRVCYLEGEVPIDVDQSATVRTRLQKKQCLEVDKPERAFFRTPTSVSKEARGSYAIFQPGTFGSAPRVGPPSKVDDDKRIRPGEFRVASAACTKPEQGVPVDPAYWGYCKLDLKGGKNYRVCFDKGYSNQGDLLEYAGGLLRVVLDRDLMRKPPISDQLDPYNYMSIEPAGCHDLLGVADAFVLVTNNSWNDQSVSAINYRYADIPTK